MKTIDEKTVFRIHYGLHEKDMAKIPLPSHGISLTVTKANNGCRKVSWHGVMFMEQNPHKDSRYALLARQGEKITWGISPRGWLLIHNNEIKNPKVLELWSQ